MKTILSRHLLITVGLISVAVVVAIFSYRFVITDKLPAIEIPDVSGFDLYTHKQIISAYEEALSHPDDPEVVGHLGSVLHNFSLYEYAMKSYVRAHLLHPGKFKWLYYLGITQAVIKQDENAIATFQKALALRPGYVFTKLRIADLLKAAGKTNEAKLLYLEVIEEDPNSAKAYFRVGQTYQTLGNTHIAAEYFRKAISLFGQYGSAHYALGLAYRDLGNKEFAEKHLSEYEMYKNTIPPNMDFLFGKLLQSSNSIRSRFKAAKQLNAQGRQREFLNALNSILKDQPGHMPTLITLIKKYKEMKRFEKAIQHYLKAMQINPNAQNAHYYYAQLLVDQNRVDEAIQIFRKVIDINPNHINAQYSLAELYEENGDIEAADTFFNQAIVSDPNHSELNYRFGKYLLRNGQSDNANEYFEKAATLRDQDVILLMDIAKAYVDVNIPFKVISYYERAQILANELKRWKQLAEIERELCYWKN